MSWSRSRRIVQLVMLAAFVALTIGGLQSGSAWLLSNLFSRLDPLVGLSAVVAGRAFVAFWAAALLTVLLTIVFGRAWCGWVCPLGTTLELAALPQLLRGKIGRGWRYGKYVTLAVVLGAALLGTLGPMILDPVSIITRPLQELARALIGNDALGQSVGASLGREGMHAVAFLSLVPLVAVLALNLVERRFWCHSLCPLGGLLALISNVPGVRRLVDAETCTSCARCAKACAAGAVDRSAGFASSSAECIVCMDCVDACQTGANRFGFSSPTLRAPRFNPARREALIAVGATGLGLAGAFLPLAANAAETETLRPPSSSEDRLASLCVRCGACYGACPTGSLRPSVSFTTPAGPWTPMLDTRPAHCTLNCNRCAVPCPTDAIHTPTDEEVVLLGLGVKAEVNHDWCRAWANNHECMKCQSICPIAGALLGQERPANLPIRRTMGSPGVPTGPVQVPVINTDLCVGCNQCATVCPMMPPAIGSPLPPQPDPNALRMPPATMPGGMRGGVPQGMPGGMPGGAPGTY